MSLSEILTDIFLIILLFFIFAFLHSYTASKSFKKRVAKRLKEKFAYFRLFYNFISIITLASIMIFSPKPDIIIYDLQFPYDIIILLMQILSFLGLIWAFKYLKFSDFTGFTKILQLKNRIYNYLEDTDTGLTPLKNRDNTLLIEGPYKICRHPLYLFSIFFLLFRPTMSLFYLTFVCSIILYFYIGSVFEERKLIEEFGDEYLNYKKGVPRIIPLKIFGGNL